MAKRQDSDREVLTSLPRSRPVRRSAKRADRPAAAQAADATPKAPAKRRPARPASAAKPAGARTAKPAPRRTEPADGGHATAARATPRRKVPAAGYAAPRARADDPPASAGAELISTTIQAAAELAQIGLTVGRQTLQSMLDRLPKP